MYSCASEHACFLYAQLEKLLTNTTPASIGSLGNAEEDGRTAQEKRTGAAPLPAAWIFFVSVNLLCVPAEAKRYCANFDRPQEKHIHI
jgi:hypothetical protein